MASNVWNDNYNPSLEIIFIQRRKIFECMTTIYHKIIDFLQECNPIKGLLDQLKQLCQMHFLYEDQILEELDHLAAAEGKHMHEMFLASIDRFRIENNQCHTSTIVCDFIKLRLEFISYMLNETELICNYIKNNSGQYSLFQA